MPKQNKEQRIWCESRLGKKRQIDKGTGHKPFGTVIDYKGDSAGQGCFFIVQSEKGNLVETYTLYPHHLRG